MEPYYKKFHTVAIPSDNVQQELGLNYLIPLDNLDSDGPVQKQRKVDFSLKEKI